MPLDHRRFAPVREAACLAHTIPGVALRLPLDNGEHLLVSRSCLGADLDPCQLRSALIVDRTHRLALVSDNIAGAEVVAGLVHLGGGLFERTQPDVPNERWFTSTLHDATLLETLERCPAGVAGDRTGGTDPISVVVKSDTELGISAVCVRCTDETFADRLDESAVRALSACLVAELLTSVSAPTNH